MHLGDPGLGLDTKSQLANLVMIAFNTGINLKIKV